MGLLLAVRDQAGEDHEEPEEGDLLVVQVLPVTAFRADNPAEGKIVNENLISHLKLVAQLTELDGGNRFKVVAD